MNLKELHIDCKNCSGLCCVALYCSKIDGFPENKDAGVPCKHLEADFKCDIHGELIEKNLRGCLNYECFGAGQKVTRMYADKGGWEQNPSQRAEIYQVFLGVTQLYQMRWYLLQALELHVSSERDGAIEKLIQENGEIVEQEPKKILSYDLEAYRERVNVLLKALTNQVRTTKDNGNKNFFGKNLKGKNLDGKDFTMALMIAANLEKCRLRRANLLGADMRDTNIKDTDLSESLFLTQMQINSAKGNAETKLPSYLSRPSTWR
ncbi:MAG: pentapeptide repeat-containing protein [Cellulosilyticaceae bacterium]